MAKSQKGGEFEREFSKVFSKWLTNGNRDDLFWRSSQSGGRATVRSRAGKTTEGSYGDITTIDSDYAFVTRAICFELKRGYNGSSVQDLLDSMKKEPEFITFWKQCDRDRELGSRLFCFVVVKRDRKKTVLIIDHNFQNRISRRFGKRLYNKVDVDYMGWRLCLVTFQEFLDSVDPEIFMEILKTALAEKGVFDATA